MPIAAGEQVCARTGRHRGPDCILHITPDQSVALHNFCGRPVILAFCPADWSPVRSDQLALYNQVLHEIQRSNAQHLGISVDNVRTRGRA